MNKHNVSSDVVQNILIKFLTNGHFVEIWKRLNIQLWNDTLLRVRKLQTFLKSNPEVGWNSMEKCIENETAPLNFSRLTFVVCSIG